MKVTRIGQRSLAACVAVVFLALPDLSAAATRGGARLLGTEIFSDGFGSGDTVRVDAEGGKLVFVAGAAP